jgi:hypothetical protein
MILTALSIKLEKLNKHLIGSCRSTFTSPKLKSETLNPTNDTFVLLHLAYQKPNFNKYFENKSILGVTNLFNNNKYF